MREILFRGKVKYNGEHYFTNDWVGGSVVKKIKGVFIHVIQMDEFGNSVKELDVEVIPETVGQFTGTTDKKGVEIFEGDLVKIGAEKEVFEVKFNAQCFLMYVGDMQYGLLGELQSFYLEVIGNIHDNPELLTIKK